MIWPWDHNSLLAKRPLPPYLLWSRFCHKLKLIHRTWERKTNLICQVFWWNVCELYFCSKLNVIISSPNFGAPTWYRVSASFYFKWTSGSKTVPKLGKIQLQILLKFYFKSSGSMTVPNCPWWESFCTDLSLSDKDVVDSSFPRSKVVSHCSHCRPTKQKIYN